MKRDGGLSQKPYEALTRQALMNLGMCRGSVLSGLCLPLWRSCSGPDKRMFARRTRERMLSSFWVLDVYKWLPANHVEELSDNELPSFCVAVCSKHWKFLKRNSAAKLLPQRHLTPGCRACKWSQL